MADRPLGVSRRNQPAPGDALLHPLAIAALCLLLVNDHVLKAAAPGAITGKLSDFAGLAFFPVLLVAAWELALAGLGRWSAPSRAATFVACSTTALVFVLAKTVPSFAELLGWSIGAAQWLLAIPVRLLADSPSAIAPASIVVDETDLIAILAMAVPLWIGQRRVRARQPLRSRLPEPVPAR